MKLHYETINTNTQKVRKYAKSINKKRLIEKMGGGGVGGVGGGMSGLSTAMGHGGDMTTVGLGSWPPQRKKRKKKNGQKRI